MKKLLFNYLTVFCLVLLSLNFAASYSIQEGVNGSQSILSVSSDSAQYFLDWDKTFTVTYSVSSEQDLSGINFATFFDDPAVSTLSVNELVSQDSVESYVDYEKRANGLDSNGDVHYDIVPVEKSKTVSETVEVPFELQTVSVAKDDYVDSVKILYDMKMAVLNPELLTLNTKDFFNNLINPQPIRENLVEADGVALDSISTSSVRTFKVKYKVDSAAETGDFVIKFESGDGSAFATLDPTWFNTSWKAYQQLKITGDHNAIVQDQNIVLSIPFNTATLISGSKMNSNCSDLRVVQNDVNSLPYEIFSCNSTSSIVRFQVPQGYSLAANTDANSTFKFYYQNTSAPAPPITLSQVYGGKNFTDFNAANFQDWNRTVFSYQYKDIDGNGYILNNKGYANGKGSGSTVDYSTDTVTPAIAFAVGQTAQWEFDYNNQNQGSLDTFDIGGYFFRDAASGGGDNITSARVSTAGTTGFYVNTTKQTTTTPAGKRIRIKIQNESSLHWTITAYVNDVAEFSNIPRTTSNSNTVYFQPFAATGVSGNLDTNSIFDNFRVFNSLANEPSYVLGTEITLPVTTSDINNSVWMTSDINFHLTCSSPLGCFASYYRLNGKDSATSPYSYIWVLDTNNNIIQRYNLATKTFDLNIGDYNVLSNLTVDNNFNIWVTSGGSNTNRINGLTGTIDKNIATGTNSNSIAVDSNGNIWVAGYSALARINPITQNVITFGASGAGWLGIAIDGNGFVYVGRGSANVVTRFNPTTQLWDINYGIAAGISGIALDLNNNLWVSNGNNVTSKINTQTNLIDLNLATGTNGLVVGDGNNNIWVMQTNASTTTVKRIDVSTNAVVATLTLGNRANGITVDANQSIWLSFSDKNMISRINPLNNLNDLNVSGFNAPFLAVNSTGYLLQRFNLNRGYNQFNLIDSNGWMQYDGGIKDNNVLISKDGNYKVEFYSKDTSDNAEAVNTQYALLDKTAPSVTSDVNNNIWQGFDSNVHLTCTDITSGCVNSYYRINSGIWNTYDKNILFSTNGTYVLDFNGLNNAGLYSTMSTVTIKIDKNVSTTTSDINNSIWQTTDANFHLTCVENPSGCYETYYRLNAKDSQTAPYPYLWITDFNSKTVQRYNTIKNTIDMNIGVTTNPTGIVVDNNFNIWITNNGASKVTRINGLTGTADKNITVGSIPRGLAIDSNGNVWVANAGDNTVSRIDPVLQTIVATIGVGIAPYGVAVDQNQNVWISNNSGNIVSRINPTTNTVDKNYGTGSGALGIAVDLNGNIWVTNQNSNTVSRINPITQTVDKNIATDPNYQPFGIAVDSNNNIWVTSQTGNKVLRINPITQTIDKIFSIGINSRGIAVDSNQNIWAINQDSNSISRINPITQLVDLNVSGFNAPFSLGDFTGWAFQNIVMNKGLKSNGLVDSNGWKQFGGGVLDSNVLVNTDGNTRVDFYSLNNAGTAETLQTQYVLKDSTPPTITTDANDSVWQTKDSNVHLTCVDSVSGCANSFYRLNLGSWQTYDKNILFHTDGNYRLDFNGLNNAGLYSTMSTVYVLIDENKPITTSDINDSIWQSFDSNVHLVCTDLTSGCASTQYRINNGSWIVFDKNILFNTDGNFKVDYNSTDVAGNVEVTNTKYVLIDKTAPTISSDANNSIWQHFDANVHLTCVDATSGCTNSYYRINSGIWNTYDKNILFHTDGNFRLDFNGINGSGLYSTMQTVYVQVDKTPPTTTSDINNNVWQSFDANVHLTCSDSTSGCNTTSYRLNAGAWTTFNTNFIISTDGNTTVDYNSTDNAGNIETTNTKYVLINHNAPTIVTFDTNYYYTGTTPYIGVKLNCTNLTSPVRNIISINDVNVIDTNYTSGTNVFNNTTVSQGINNVKVYCINTANNTITQDRNVLVAGNIFLHIRDENSNTGLNPVVTFDGNNFTSTDGNYMIPISGLTTGTYSITTSLTNYAPRTFTFDLNQFSFIEENLLLLQSNKSQVIVFKFYQPDKIKLLPNAYVTIKDINNWISGRIKLDSQGEGTLTLQPFDKNYWFDINAIDGNNYTYQPVKVTVKIPLREDDLVTPILTFNINLSGNNGALIDQNLSQDTNIQVYSNTKYPYVFAIDSNQTQYLQRSYDITITGNDINYILQPYLIDSTNSVSLTILTFDSYSRATLENIRIEIQKSLPSGLVTVQSLITDATGTATGNFIIGDTYFFNFYQDLNLLTTKEVRPTTAAPTLFFFLNTISVSTNLPTWFNPSVTWTPDTNEAGTLDWTCIPPNSGTNCTYNFAAEWKDLIGYLPITTTLTINQNGTELYNNTVSNTDTVTITLDANLFDTTHPVTMDSCATILTIGTTTLQFCKTKTLFVSKSGVNWKNIISGVFKDELGQGGSILIAILLTIIIVGFFASKAALDYSALTFIAIGVLGMFVMLGVISIELWGLCFLGGLTMFFLEKNIFR